MKRFIFGAMLAACLLNFAAAQTTATTSAPASAKPKAVKFVHLHLGGQIAETPVSDPFQLMGGSVSSLKSIIEKMERAREDDAVRGVVVTWNNLQLGLGQAEEIRAAMLRLKSAGKPVLVHVAGEGPTLTMHPYAMLSGASRLSIEPRSDVWLTGLAGEQLYLKDMLGKVGVSADWMHMGAYKSAGEMFTNTAPSPEADAMMNWLFDGLYDGLVSMIAEGRGLDADEVKKLVDGGPYVAGEALKAKLVDTVEYEDEFLAGLKREYGDGVTIDNRYEAEKQPKVDFSNPFALLQALSPKTRDEKKPVKGMVAVVYVDGMILSGHGQPNPFGGGGMAHGGDVNYWLMQAAKDSDVKAVVLRVDSPGGSALGSDQIWRATQEVRKTKPLVASMGNVAASGGYYSSCGAQSIFADRNTITASIGVVGGKFVTTEMWQKLGVNWVPYQRGSNAMMFESGKPFTPEQRAKFEEWLQTVYAEFQEKVKSGREGKLKKSLEDLAGGRVFTGAQAKEHGLIDEIGGLEDAVAHAAQLAGLTDYEAQAYPKPKDFFQQLIEEMSGEAERETDLQVGLGGAGPSINFGRETGLLPSALKSADPARFAAMERAFKGLALLREEGVALMMPFELVIQ